MKCVIDVSGHLSLLELLLCSSIGIKFVRFYRAITVFCGKCSKIVYVLIEAILSYKILFAKYKSLSNSTGCFKNPLGISSFSNKINGTCYRSVDFHWLTLFILYFQHNLCCLGTDTFLCTGRQRALHSLDIDSVQLMVRNQAIFENDLGGITKTILAPSGFKDG